MFSSTQDNNERDLLKRQLSPVTPPGVFFSIIKQKKNGNVRNDNSRGIISRFKRSKSCGDYSE